MTTQKTTPDSTESKAGSSGPGASPAPAEAPPMGGYNQKILRVNLTHGTLTTEPLSYEMARKYVGGAGLVAYYLLKEIKAGADPLGPDNKLVFALGPVSGLALPGAARYCVGAKSPLTGGVAKSESGGVWMADLKRAGFDVIIVEGKADKPVYLWVKDGEASLKSADKLWGKETKETQEAIRAELGDEKIQTVSIGPAGENLVNYSCIMTGSYDAAGRGGMGAVMGSKNLKAIAVRGTTLPSVANEDYIKTLRQELNSRPSWLSDMGTGGPEMPMFEQTGNLPVRNFRDGLFPGVKQTTGVTIKETIRIGMDGCYACPIRCKKVVKFEEPYICDPAYGGPEYETLAALGSNCGVDDIKAISKANERCNAHAIDTISAGASIAFAMECFEKGLLTKQDTGGMDLSFGNGDTLVKLIDMIAKREGIGNFIADGTARMAKKLGQNTSDFAMNGKGLEPGMHEPRINLGLKIGYLLSPHGADHCSSFGGGTNPESAAGLNPFGIISPVTDEISPKRMSLAKLNHCMSMVNDYLVVCLFPGINNDQKVELLKAVTGWNTGWVDMLKISERILTTMRLFNVRHGFTEADDDLPERFYQNKTDGVLATGKIVDRASMEKGKKWYYFYMGWDEKGVPTPEKLAELDIDFG